MRPQQILFNLSVAQRIRDLFFGFNGNRMHTPRMIAMRLNGWDGQSHVGIRAVVPIKGYKRSLTGKELIKLAQRVLGETWKIVGVDANHEERWWSEQYEIYLSENR
jgi:hypothetical protein